MIGGLLFFVFLMISVLFVLPKLIQRRRKPSSESEIPSRQKSPQTTKYQQHQEILQCLFERQSQVVARPKITFKLQQSMLDEDNSLNDTYQNILSQLQIKNELICLAQESLPYNLDYVKICYVNEGSVSAIVRSLKPKAHVDNTEYDKQLTNFVKVLRWEGVNETINK